MGYSWNGVCYPDTATVLEAFSRSVPAVDSAGMNVLTAAPTITAGGLVSWSIRNWNASSNATNTRTGTTQLLACATPDASVFPVQSLLIASAIVFAGLFGFRTGYRP